MYDVYRVTVFNFKIHYENSIGDLRIACVFITLFMYFIIFLSTKSTDLASSNSPFKYQRTDGVI